MNNKELITLIDDNNVMYVGECHSANDVEYSLRNVVTVGYNVNDQGTVSISIIPVGIPDIILNKNNVFVRILTSKVKIELVSDFTPDFIEKYNSVFTTNE